jgi:hypothetical protein
MLGEFPGYTSHVRWQPCKDVSVLTEELDERDFLFGTQVCPDGGGLGSIASDKFHLFCVNCRLESGQGGGNFLLGCRHFCRIHGNMDFFEFLAEEHDLCEGGFALLALLCLPEAAINGDDTIRSWHFQLIVDVARPGMETVEGGAAEYHVVCAFEGNHLKGYRLFVEIVFIAEGDLECDGP